MQIAFVHDHLIQIGGGERVLQTLHEMFPEAPIYTLFFNERNLISEFPNAKIHTSFLQKIPGAVSHYQWFLPLMPKATEKYDLSGFDIVLSSSSALSKGIKIPPTAFHICYCHTPTRYLWSDSESYIRDLKKPGIIKMFIPKILENLRKQDYSSAQKVNLFIANSKTVQKRIKKYYNRSSVVIYPPINMEDFAAAPGEGSFFLAGGRLVPYKRFDITIRAFNRLGLPLKIFGEGPILDDLKKMAKSNIEFLGLVSDLERLELYQNSIAFIHPQIEDLGLTALESMACGRPVVAYKEGGATETVIESVTGTFFERQMWESLYDKVFHTDFSVFNPEAIRRQAMKFDKNRFCLEIKKCLDKCLAVKETYDPSGF